MSSCTKLHFLDIRDLCLPREELAASLKVLQKPLWREQLYALMDEAEKIARPKVCWVESRPEFISDEELILEGCKIHSRTLVMAFQKAMEWKDGLVFPFVATCGKELDEWYSNAPTGLPAFWAQAIAEYAMQVAVKTIEAELKSKEGVLSRIEPGIPADWPLTEQQTLFSILEGGPESIGVHLNEHLMMIPFKSVSGIYFLSERFLSPCSYCLFKCERKNGRTCWHGSGQ